MATNLAYLERHGLPGRLLQSHVRYRRERLQKEGRRLPESFRDLPTLWRTGYGDCEDLSAALIAELLFQGFAAAPLVEHNRSGWHVLVSTPWGAIDPSVVLLRREREQNMRVGDIGCVSPVGNVPLTELLGTTLDGQFRVTFKRDGVTETISGPFDTLLKMIPQGVSLMIDPSSKLGLGLYLARMAHAALRGDRKARRQVLHIAQRAAGGDAAAQAAGRFLTLTARNAM